MGYVVGDQINKIVAQRAPLAKKMTITTNISVSGVERKDLIVGDEKKPGISFSFVFKVDYTGTQNRIEIEGNVFWWGDKKELDAVEKDWKEKKQVLNQQIAVDVNNRALEVGLLQAIALANQLRIPAPIRLPKFVPTPTGEQKPAKETKPTAKAS